MEEYCFDLGGKIKTINGEGPDETGNVNIAVSGGALTGSVTAWAGRDVPEGYLLCNGAEIDRKTYAELFKVIGCTYGFGDGVNTFNLPNLVDIFIQGGDESGKVIEAGLPDIAGGASFTSNALIIDGAFGALYGQRIQGYNAIAEAAMTAPLIPETSGNDLYFLASKWNEIYGASETVQPPALTMQYIIKY